LAALLAALRLEPLVAFACAQGVVNAKTIRCRLSKPFRRVPRRRQVRQVRMMSGSSGRRQCQARKDDVGNGGTMAM
jgi:hypothetical protein